MIHLKIVYQDTVLFDAHIEELSWVDSDDGLADATLYRTTFPPAWRDHAARQPGSNMRIHFLDLVPVEGGMRVVAINQDTERRGYGMTAQEAFDDLMRGANLKVGIVAHHSRTAMSHTADLIWATAGPEAQQDAVRANISAMLAPAGTTFRRPMTAVQITGKYRRQGFLEKLQEINRKQHIIENPSTNGVRVENMTVANGATAEATD